MRVRQEMSAGVLELGMGKQLRVVPWYGNPYLVWSSTSFLSLLLGIPKSCALVVPFLDNNASQTNVMKYLAILLNCKCRFVSFKVPPGVKSSTKFLSDLMLGEYCNSKEIITTSPVRKREKIVFLTRVFQTIPIFPALFLTPAFQGSDP